MLRKKTSKFHLFNARRWNERGFTLSEMLFGFSIFTLIVFFLSPLLQMSEKEFMKKRHLQEMEWDVFVSQIKFEIHSSVNATVSSNTLYITSPYETVSYEKYGSTLRRRVNETGHEILLQNVEKVDFITLQNGIRVTVIDSTNTVHTASAYSFLDWNHSP